MIVVDASAAVSALLRVGTARERLSRDVLHAPHVIDIEIVDVMRKLVQRRALTETGAVTALSAWKRLGIRRHPTIGLLDRQWELRHNASAYDAAYVALAEALQCHLVTADQRLASAIGPRCMIEIVPR